MGKKSRQKRLRRALRPVAEAQVRLRRSQARNDPMNWNILPTDEEAAVSGEPEQEKVKARIIKDIDVGIIAAVEASRR